jgi:hypothetical protein
MEKMLKKLLENKQSNIGQGSLISTDVSNNKNSSQSGQRSWSLERCHQRTQHQ